MAQLQPFCCRPAARISVRRWMRLAIVSGQPGRDKRHTGWRCLPADLGSTNVGVRFLTTNMLLASCIAMRRAVLPAASFDTPIIRPALSVCIRLSPQRMPRVGHLAHRYAKALRRTKNNIRALFPGAVNSTSAIISAATLTTIFVISVR